MKIILNILLILVVISTISICFTKPDLHKTVLIYDSGYVITPQEEIKTETETIPIMEKPQKPVETVTKIEQNVSKQIEPVKKVVTQSLTKNSTQNTVNKSTQNTINQKPTTVTKQETKKQVQAPVVKTVQTTKPVETKTVTTVQPTKKVLTEREETIAWNIWRSNLQNKIMQDTKLPIIPQGIVFRFSFTVDKYGKITNLQTWSDSSTYTPYAIQYIAPVIRSYQGRSILNFPEGTVRTITDVKGGWKISESEKYSTPQDYNDYEKVKK